MRLEDARKLAMALPTVTEEPHHDMTSWRIRGKLFATAPPDGKHLHVFVDEGEVRAAASEAPQTYEELWWGKRLSGVRVNLSSAKQARVKELLTEAWLRKAPKTDAAEFAAAHPGRRPTGLTS